MATSVTIIRVYEIDANTDNWASFFGSLTIGSVISASSAANPANTWTFSITSKVDNGLYYTFNVTNISSTGGVSQIGGSLNLCFTTAGSSGTSGTSGAGVPAWTSSGVITLTATTTSPVKGTTTSDNIRYRQVGAKEWEIVLTYIQTVASGNSGSGDYLITLPNSLSFDTSLPSQQIYTASVGTSTFALFPYVIPSANGTITNLGVGGQLFPIIYNSTRFRILTITYGSGIQCWGSGFYSLGTDVPKIQLTFSFTST